ncbi:hypothetical protein CO615_04650 [Lysobacteraceae bacterium NML75-0749]|nr:hypothetical protein CO615_04650 [Xanthomonadaceae bacterium NML75-0749]
MVFHNFFVILVRHRWGVEGFIVEKQAFLPPLQDVKGAMEALMRAYLGDGLAGQSVAHWQVEDGWRYQLFQGGWELAAIADAAGIRLILRRPKPVWIPEALQDSPLYASNG